MKSLRNTIPVICYNTYYFLAVSSIFVKAAVNIATNRVNVDVIIEIYYKIEYIYFKIEISQVISKFNIYKFWTNFQVRNNYL